jgi:hypothetical protein
VRDSVITMNTHLARMFLAWLCFFLPCISHSSSSVDICQQPIAESHLSIAYYDQEPSSFEGNVGETDLENFSADLLFKSRDTWSFGAGYRGAFLNVDGLALQTNGYLHTVFVPIHRLSQSDKRGFRFSVAPALSASSNVVTDPDEYTADAVQLLAALVWNRQMSDRLDLHYGICGDHRFGEYQAYPLINASWQVHPDWLIQIGYPTSQIIYRASKRITSSLRIAPNGNEWYVKDKSLVNHSQLVYEAYLLEWLFNWRAHKHFMLTAKIGREFDSRYEMTLLNQDRVRLSSDSATRVGLALAWLF